MSDGTDQEVWVDVTKLFKDASSELLHSEPMIYHESFSLFEAMSAVEIMDPKMDQRFNLTEGQNQASILNLQCPENFDNQTLARLLISLTPLEVAFMDGFSVLETTHHCIGLWEKSWAYSVGSENMSWAVFISFCKATNQIIHHINNAILDAEIYEEEDFQPVTSAYVCATLEDDDLIRSLTSHVKSLPAEAPAIIPSLLEFKASQISLFRVMRDWIRFNVQQSRPTSPQPDDLVAKVTDFAMRAKDSLKSARETLTKLQSGAISGQLHENNDESIQFAFSSDLVKLSQTSPARLVTQKPFEECPAYFSTLFNELSLIVEVFEELVINREKTVDFERLLQLALDHSRKCYHVLSRSLLKSFFDFFSPDMPALVQRAMAARGIPAEYIEDELVKVRWSNVICKVARETLKILAGNRSKLLVRLDNALGSWGMIGSEAPYVDQQVLLNSLSKQPSTADADKLELQDWFTSFIMLPTVLLMDLEMELLIEMDLLSLNELGYFYWYWDYVCASQTWALERLRSLKSHRISAEHAAQVKAKKAGSSAAPAPLLPSIEELGVMAKMQICRGQLRMVLVAQTLGAVTVNDVPHTTWSKKFEQRFRAFHTIANPPPLVFDTYDKLLKSGLSPKPSGDSSSTSMHRDVTSILQAASACYLRGRQYIDCFRGANKGGVQLPCDSAGDESFKAISAVLYKVVVANSVNVTKVMKLLETKEGVSNTPCTSIFKLSIQKQYHRHYPVFEISS